MLKLAVTLRIAIAATLLMSGPKSVTASDWTMWGRSSGRNNVSPSDSIPASWDIGEIDRKTRLWDPTTGENVRWVARLGSQTHGSPVVADGRVFIGTNNSAAYLKRASANVDLGCLLAFRESDGEFLWQYSADKLQTGRIHDWPMQGICSTPLVDGHRMWLVDNRGRVTCLDTHGFHDGEDDGTVLSEEVQLFAMLPGVANETTPRWWGGRTERSAIYAMLVAHNLSTRKCSRFVKSLGGNRWDVFAQGGTPIYRIEIDDSSIEITSLDMTKPTKPSAVVNRDEVRALNRHHLMKSIRSRFAKAGVELPDEVSVKPIERDKEWTVSAVIDGDRHDFHLRMNGLWLIGHKRLSVRDTDEADIVWQFDMMNELGVSQHNMANCSPVSFGDALFVCTSNGVDESHSNVPAPDAASFIAIDRNTGKLLWSDASPGRNILHGQWSSPSVGVMGGVPQVVFCGGDGWVYSFRADKWDEKDKAPVLLWKFDANPKTSKWSLGGRGTRNNIVAFPVIYEERVYVAVGQEPEHGEGNGHLWCIDPTKRGDVSPELAMKRNGQKLEPLPHQRLQAVNEKLGDVAVPNPNSAVIWHYAKSDQNGDGEISFEEEFHRTISSPVIKDGLLVASDFSGLLHCLDARTGKMHWTCDLLAACWSTPLIVGDRILVGDEDGDVAIVDLSAKPKGLSKQGGIIQSTQEVMMRASINSTPVGANDTLFIATKSHLFAIAK